MLPVYVVSVLFLYGGSAARLYDKILDDDYQLSRRVYKDNPDCKRDIVVLWDNSNSIGRTPFKDEVIPFFEKLIQQSKLNVREDGTRFGFISFSDSKRTRWILDLGEKSNKIALVKWLKEQNYDDLNGRKTYTGKAFELVNKKFTHKSPKNYRQDVKDVVLLFTDGRPNGAIDDDQKKMAQSYFKKLKEKNIPVIGFGFGPKFEEKESKETLESMTTSFETLADLKDPQKNQEAIKKIISETCQGRAATCRCIPNEEDGTITEYVRQGEKKLVKIEKPDLNCTNNPTISEPVVSPPGPDTREFTARTHEIKYTYKYNDGMEKEHICTKRIVIIGCECPPEQTVTATLNPGEVVAFVRWDYPDPTSDCRMARENKLNSGQYGAGEYEVEHKYIKKDLTLKCKVKIIVKGRCGDDTYNPSTQECCCGKVYTKQDDIECCGYKYYKKSDGSCCDKKNGVWCPKGKTAKR